MSGSPGSGDCSPTAKQPSATTSWGSLATFVPQPLVPPPWTREDLSALAYTGGTTGKPKGVMNTYRGSATMAQLMMSELQWPDEVRHLICTPLSHAGSSLFVPLQLQGAAMFVLPTFDAGAVLEAIERHRITTTMLVPSMIYALLDHPRFEETDLSSLQTVFYGASAMSPARLQEAIRKLGPIFVQFYGQTEAPMTVCVLRKEDHDVDDLDATRVVRPSASLGARSRCSTTTATRSRGANRVNCACVAHS